MGSSVEGRTDETERFSDEQILAIVREGEAGRKVSDLCRTHGITGQTYCRWKAKFGGMELSEMQRLKQLEYVAGGKAERRRHDGCAAESVTGLGQRGC